MGQWLALETGNGSRIPARPCRPGRRRGSLFRSERNGRHAAIGILRAPEASGPSEQGRRTAGGAGNRGGFPGFFAGRFATGRAEAPFDPVSPFDLVSMFEALILRARHASAMLPGSLVSPSTLGRCCSTLLAASRGSAFFAVDDRPMGPSSFPK